MKVIHFVYLFEQIICNFVHLIAQNYKYDIYREYFTINVKVVGKKLHEKLLLAYNFF